MTVDASDGSLAAPVARSRVPAVMRVNGKDVLWPNPVYQAVCRRYFPRLAAVVANSRMTAARAAALGVPADRIHVVHPPAQVPSGAWRPDPQPGRILIAARLVPVKGVVEFVADVWPRIAAGNPAARLDVAGDGPLMPRLRDAVAKAAHGDRVHLHGMLGQARLDDLYRKASLLAVTSRPMAWGSEGFGMVCAEAAMRGVPTVAYAVGGLPDAVVDGRTGWLLQDLDPARVAERFLQHLEGPRPDPKAMAALAEERWGMARFARQYCAVHEAVAREGPTAPNGSLGP